MGKGVKIIVNCIIFLVIVGFVWYMVHTFNQEETTYAEPMDHTEEPFTSNYQPISAFSLPEEINRIELFNNKLYISAELSLYIYDLEGNLLSSFSVKPHVRDIAVEEGNIYVLYPTYIEVYNENGEISRQWEACSELSDYCSCTIAGDYLFVTDAENKNVCQYTREGNFSKFIQSPQGFVIPSYSFDIASYNDTLYCANSGRHQVEAYTLDGDFIAAFGKAGGEAGSFAGCCNPSYITFTSNGELITSEKGIPRISSFESNGRFREVLINKRLLGGGNKAYEVKAYENKLFTTGKNTIQIWKIN